MSSIARRTARSCTCSRPRSSPAQVVAGEIDAARRRDHIQQHTGQHVLSAAFVHACNAPTVSFHLGADTSTIDISATLDAVAVARGEDEANRIVWEDRAVTVRYASAEEAAALPLRKESKRTGTLRLVDIENWDLSACGGTHVSRTGSIGAILVTGWERYKGGTRVAFACGDRAVRHARALRDVVAGATRLLSIKPEELVDAVTRLQAEAKDARLQARALGESLAAFEAERFVREAAASGSGIVARVVDRDANGLKSLALAIAALGSSAVLVSKSRPCLVVAARGCRPSTRPPSSRRSSAAGSVVGPNLQFGPRRHSTRPPSSRRSSRASAARAAAARRWRRPAA